MPNNPWTLKGVVRGFLKLVAEAEPGLMVEATGYWKDHLDLGVSIYRRSALIEGAPSARSPEPAFQASFRLGCISISKLSTLPPLKR